MPIRTTSAAAALALFFGGHAFAGGISYDEYQLAARVNFSGAYNVPTGVFFTNADVTFSSAGVACSTSGGVQGVWYDPGLVPGFNGSIVYSTGGFVGDASLNESGRIVFEQSLSAADGVYLYEAGSTSQAFNINLFSGYSTPQINDNDRIAYRGQTGGGAQFFASDVIGGGASPAFHVGEVGFDSMSPYSFLFTPSFNNNDQIAGKARRGAAGQFGESQPDEIRIWNADGSSVLIAQDADADPMSPYGSFDNSVGLTDDGWVAFTANLEADDARAVFLSDGTTTIEIASENDPGVSEIEFFAPSANSDGLVVFRAFDGAGLRTVFVGDGDQLVSVAKKNDLIDTDLGEGRIDQNVDSSPVFGGAPAINGAGDVGFLAGLTPPDNDQIEWGTGLYIARRATVDADLDGDGSVGSGDLGILLAAWGSSDPAADLDGDGTVGSGDLGILLAAWG